MKFDDHSQNLAARITTIQIITIVALAILGVRLYYLQMVRGEYFTEKARNQSIRQLRIPAPRGAIFDRFGRILVDSRSTYNILLDREATKSATFDSMIEPFAKGLQVEEDFLRERLTWIKAQPEFEAVTIKENATIGDIGWVEAHQLEYPELRIELQPQRNYPLNKTLSHVLGYVGEISPKQLEDPAVQARGFKSGDIVGKGGLEQYYDEYLRGKPGYRKVVVDSRGRVQEDLETVPPQAGQDLYTTIDLDLQLAAEHQLEISVTKRGTIISMNPNNGEVLAMASAPTFDPNSFVTRIATREGRKEITDYYTNKERPLLNRAIQGRYPPGSTWKIPESVAALQQGVITTKSSNITCGGGIQIGNRFTRDTSGNHGAPDLRTAITKSCDGYYYRLGLKMGIDGIIKMIEEFGYDKPSGIDLPNEKTPRTPKYYRPFKEKEAGKWQDIETVFCSIGQVTVEATPLSMLRAVSSVSVQGKLFVPHLLKEFKETAAVGDESEENFVAARPGFGYQNSEPKIIEMTPEQNKMVVDGMWGVVNNGGTAHAIKMNDFVLAGKTGTAQVTEVGNDKGKLRDHSWFVSFAPAYKPEISVICIIENSGFGASNAAPAVKGVYEAYLQVREKYNPEAAPVQVASETANNAKLKIKN